MILAVFTDIIPFLMILIAAILVFACLEINISKSIEGDGFTGSFNDFWKKIDQVYDIGYGNWDGQNEYPTNLYSIYLFQTLLFPLVMFNLLIAIISQTFETYVEDREKFDIEELMEILLDYDSLFVLRQSCFRGKREPKYLHIFTAVD